MIKQLLTLIFCFQFSSPLWANSILIATVAQVRNHVITSRELAIHDALDKVLGSQFNSLRLDQSLERLIREWLLFYEAKSFYNNQVADVDVETHLKKSLAGLKKKGIWDKLALTENEVRQKIVRRLEADRLFIFKKKASILPVSLSELEAEYTQNRVRYGAASFSDVREEIRQIKGAENLNQRLEQWFQVLETKYNVQRFANFAPQVKK